MSTAAAGPAADDAAPIVPAPPADRAALAGLGPELLAPLQQVRFVFAGLPEPMPARTRRATLYLDPDAAGFDRFIESTPPLDDEFVPTGSSIPWRAVDSSIAEPRDLLMIAGHARSLPDPLAGGIMGGTRQPGRPFRRGAAERDAFFAALADVDWNH